ncbi:hypothetical protein D7V80_30335 [Corallococcus sp. CA054B]|nr:hypothetical protein D7V80_30335 [Corallococcus sp. CA054B]
MPGDDAANTSTNLMLIPEDGVTYSIEEVRALKLGIENIIETKIQNEQVFMGKHKHATKFWHESLKPYKSQMSGMSLIEPLWGHLRDPYFIHILILYGLSIAVRYLPDVWHEIVSGRLDALRSLIDFYLNVVDALVPGNALERITGESFLIEQSGSIFAPI